MKYVFVFSFCLLLFSCKEKRKEANDLTKMMLNGQVKTLTETDYFLDSTGAKKGKVLRWTKTTAFNEKGFITEKTQLDDKGKPSFKYTYAYDAANRLQEEKAFGDELLYTTTYTYDTVNHTATSRCLFADGSKLVQTTNYRYNKAGQLLNTTVTSNPDGADSNALVYTETYAYDKQGHKINCIHADADSFTQTIAYTYDEHGNCTSEIADKARAHHAIKTLTTYDAQGNELTETAYEVDGAIHTQKTARYQNPDSADNWQLQYIHWKDLGTTLTERTITYY